MTFARPVACCLVAAGLATGSPLAAQTQSPASPSPAPTTSQVRPLDTVPAPAFSRLLSETAADFKRVPTRQNLTWLGLAAAAAAVAGPSVDPAGSEEFSELKVPGGSMTPGTVIGSAPAQFGSALITYGIGRATGNARAAQVGADLFRAQAIAQSLSYGLKWSIRRTRPDGSSFSFPSGHTAVSFASATVLQRHLGWKAGVPAYAVASYVAASRVHGRRHFVSDVAFGAILGIVAGRTVTVGRGDARFAVAPIAAPGGGGGVAFTWLGHR
jgi:membrane-associated phospholipid phosphatase